MDRAYAVVTVKTVDEEQRLIAGVASTPEVDRAGDVVDPSGAKFASSIPLLLHHDSRLPVGSAFLKRSADGITFSARIPRIDEPGTLKARVDEAWQSVKSGLIKGVSIGFRAAEDGFELMKGGGLKFTDFEVLELSLVSVPANQSASIATIKSIDAEHLAAFGPSDRVSSSPAGVSASVVKTAHKGAKAMKISEQIVALETRKETAIAAMTAIQEKATAEGRLTKDESEKQEFASLKDEVKQIDEELVDLRDMEATLKTTAVPVHGVTPKAASDTRSAVITVTPTLPKGTAFTRYVMAMAAGRGSRMEALQYAKRWEKSTPEVAMVLKAAVEAGTTTDATWASPLVVYQNMASEFIELLRPATIIGKINGFRRVPFNITMPRTTSGSTVGWVGQGAPKPAGEMAFDQVSLGMAKAAGIVVISEELARSSNPAAEAVISQDLRDAIAEFLDAQFVDPAVAEVANVSPAAVTNGASVIDSTGTTAAALRTDFASALAVWTAADMSIAGGVVLMTETQAIRLGMIVNSLGQPEFPGISATGGSLFGLPVVTSENIPAEGGSPAGNRIILLKPGEVLLADDGGVNIDVSREASLQMNSTPDNPASASTVFRSLWQDNLVGIRAERFINWKKRRSAAAVVIEGAVYTGA